LWGDPPAVRAGIAFLRLSSRSAPGASGYDGFAIGRAFHGLAVGGPSIHGKILVATQLSTALSNDPNAVSNLLDSTTGPFGALLTQLQGYEDPSNSSAYVQSNQTSLTTEISDLQTREANEQEIINNYQTMIEAQFTAMETTLATLQSQSAQIAAEMGYSTSSSSSSSSTVAKPCAALKADKVSGKHPLAVTFSYTGTGGTPDSYTWNFGDKTSSFTTTAKTVKHTFAKAGTYTVSVTAKNKAGSSTATKSKYITIK